MQTQSSSDLAAKLVETVTPWLDSDESGVLHMALGAETSRRMITALLAIVEQKQCVLPADLAEELANWRRPPRSRQRGPRYRKSAVHQTDCYGTARRERLAR